MKSIKLFLILFIIPLILSDEDSFSINPFIERLRNEVFFDIIKSIKKSFGQDVAIISCEELNKNYSNNCKRLVLEYMPDYGEYEIITRGLLPASMKLSPELIKSEIKEIIKTILNKKFDIEESSLIADNIINKIKISVFYEIIKKIISKNKIKK